jgi:hypothetical protein
MGLEALIRLKRVSTLPVSRELRLPGSVWDGWKLVVSCAVIAGDANTVS